jgi:chemotaxis protein histidine kinase CheA
VRDRASVAEFIDEANSIVVALVDRDDRDSLQLRRLAHTLKGNAAFFGLRRLADAAHAYEGALSDDSADANPAAIVALWDETCDRVRPFLGDDGQLHVTASDLEHLRARLHQGAGVNELLELVESLRAEPARRRLERMADAVRSVAGRLGKTVEVNIVADAHLRLPASLKGFWPAAVHLVRNAVDHGLESSAERLAQGKPTAGRVCLIARIDNGALQLTVSDDGRGINWSRLRARAEERGLRSQSHDDLVEVLFTDGVSTRDEASDVSGRGVGMAAVREAALAHGGHIDVHSEPNAGTTITVTLPVHPIETHDAAALLC